MMTALLPILLLTAGLNPQGPSSVALTSQVQTWRAQAVANDVSAYLAERVYEAWALDSVQEPAQFDVTLRWPDPGQVQITIRQAERIWVDRPLKVEDPSSARAMVWLLVRSTVERALMHAAASPETPPIAETPPIGDVPVADVPVATEPAEPPPVVPPPAMEIQPTVSATIAVAPIVATASVAATSPSEPTPTPVAKTSSVGSRQLTLSRLWERPYEMKPGEAIEGSMVMRSYVDVNSGVSAGLAVQARLQIDHNFVLGGEVGFYDEDKATNLSIKHLPISVNAGYVFSQDLPLEIGVSATFDARLVSVQGTQPMNPTNSLGVAAGLLTGAYVRTYYTFWQKDAAELRVTGEFTLNMALARSAYIVASQRIEDGPVLLSTGVGLQWRWH